MILAGDIGGTNTRLAVYDDALACVEEQSYTNAGRPGLEDALAEFGPRTGITAACFGVAGPVAAGRVRLTNLDWVIESKGLAEYLDLPPERVRLVNDLYAHGASTEAMGPADLEVLQPGEAVPRGDRAVVMPGTGLGVGALTFDELAGHHRPFASEGGHADFAPRDDQQDRLLRSLRLLKRAKGDTSVSWEDCLSGPGLRNLYACLASPDRPDVGTAPTPKRITDTAATDETAAAAVALFVRLLGQAAGGYGLTFLATGGVYLGGNIAAVLAAELSKGAFLSAFTGTGPPAMSAALARMPVLRMKPADTGLRGAAQVAQWAQRER